MEPTREDYEPIQEDDPFFTYWNDDDQKRRLVTGANALISLVNDGEIERRDAVTIGHLASMALGFQDTRNPDQLDSDE